MTCLSVGLALGALTACLEVAEERALAEESIGLLERAGLRLEVADGASSIRLMEREGALLKVDLWAQGPTQALTITPLMGSSEPPPSRLMIRWHNMMVGSTLEGRTSTGAPLVVTAIPREEGPATRLDLRIPLSAEGLTVTVTPPEPPLGAAWRVGVFADIQERLDGLSELLTPLAQEPVRFCLISGDLTSQGSFEELRTFQDGLERHLPFPCYATLGNHELGSPGPPFHRLFGRGSYSFTYGGARFTLLDDASATLAPRTYTKLKSWLQAGREQLHLITTHLPILDVDGTRSGAFASRTEAIELLSLIAEGAVDQLLYGHVHTFKSFKQAGMRALISGGGGSIPMRFDGVGRHYVVLTLESAEQQVSYRVREISPAE